MRFCAKVGRPGLAPGVYFRALLVGYFEGIDFERGIAVADGGLAGAAIVSRFRTEPGHAGSFDDLTHPGRLIDVETHRQVFLWVLGMLARRGIAERQHSRYRRHNAGSFNAALRSIVRRDNGQAYDEFLKGLAKESGIDTPTREQLARLDRKPKEEGSPNDDWKNLHDQDAQITKMKGWPHASGP